MLFVFSIIFIYEVNNLYASENTGSEPYIFIYKWKTEGIEPLTIDSAGNVQNFNSSGNFIAQWKIRSDNSSPSSGISPKAITVDTEDNIYAVEHKTEAIQKFNASGKFTAKWNVYYYEYTKKLEDIRNISGETEENIFVISGSFQMFYKFITKFAGRKEKGKFDKPIGIKVDLKSNLYVINSDKHEIQKFATTPNYIVL